MIGILVIGLLYDVLKRAEYGDFQVNPVITAALIGRALSKTRVQPD